MSDELVRLKESTQDLVSQALDACSNAYLQEFQKECQSRGTELAATAAKIKADRAKTEKDALESNEGRFKLLRDKNKELRDKNQALNPEEQSELDSYEKKLSQDLKPIKLSEEQLKNEATPFVKIYKIVTDLALQKQQDPNLDISKAFDEYEDKSEYKPEDEGKRITENDKLLTLFYLRDFAQNFGIHFAKTGQVIKDAEDDEYRKSMDSMIKTANLYMIGRSKNDNGKTVVGSSIFSDTNNSIIAMTNILFGSDKVKGRDIVSDTYNRMINFCNKKASQMILDNLDKEKIIQGSPYFNKQNSKYNDHIDRIRMIKASAKYLTKEDKKSLAERELDKAKLSFGRSGSTQFSEMGTAYKDFQKRLNDYVNDSKDLQKKYLLQASIDRLDKKAGAYLDYKNNQMLNKEIDVKIVKDKDGAVKEVIPANSKTLQRMKLAAKIREDMSKQREFYADKKAQLANDKKPQSVQII